MLRPVTYHRPQYSTGGAGGTVMRSRGSRQGDHRSDDRTADLLLADASEGYRVREQLARQPSIADTLLVLLLLVLGCGLWWISH